MPQNVTVLSLMYLKQIDCETEEQSRQSLGALKNAVRRVSGRAIVEVREVVCLAGGRTQGAVSARAAATAALGKAMDSPPGRGPRRWLDGHHGGTGQQVVNGHPGTDGLGCHFEAEGELLFPPVSKVPAAIVNPLKKLHPGHVGTKVR